jgi:hypothetical protein
MKKPDKKENCVAIKPVRTLSEADLRRTRGGATRVPGKLEMPN